MKKTLLFAFVTSLIIGGCHNGNSSQSNAGGFTIQGTISTMDSGWVYLQRQDSSDITQDSTQIADHKFSFTGKVTEPTLYHLWAGKGAYYVGHSGRKYSNPKALTFFVEDTTIQITIQDSINKAVVSSSPSEDLYVAYKKIVTPFDAKGDALDACYEKADAHKDKTVTDSLDKVSAQVDKDENATIASFAEGNPNAIISAWAVTSHMLYVPDLDALNKVYASFSPAVQQSSYGVRIKRIIDIKQRLGVGQMALDFTLNDTASQPVSLSSLHGKYVLVDFWASWCPDCRRENPNVVRIYNKFKNKNFTILGVSLDTKKANWVKAIHDEELAWMQVSDLKGWENSIAKMYAIKSIPANYLLDPDGKIIAHNLMGADLEKELQTVLK